ncbi:Acyl-[acyl-carrier-protein]--UDP-N-acetylglucosamine O-acyltransferase [Cedecea lapagei]|uniref:Acyl-[acyl-carrier-protein]--UDP-N-acetylglucosamine O-acyltransferase n=1 Tax=Cedecea lapagei TaxID=158823 RepID=A0A447V0L1_9ENTR|nr:acetyltransferase [Cedecea lapagei]VEB96530.1 Acyl-[acyl-carrier-protein]--UDP-N-acetylglucosamine O-acyltransferase [Cedecea lapagei]
MRLGILGGGGLGREVLVLARQINSAGRWSEIFIIDDFIAAKEMQGVKVVRSSEAVYDDVELVIAIGEPSVRETLAKQFITKCPLATLIHPQVFIPEDTKISAGCIIFPGVFISCNVTLGDNCIVQAQSVIAHDCTIGAHTVFASHVTLAGRCRLGERVFLGMSCAVKENTEIGNDVIIGMGAMVFTAISDRSIARGNPAVVTVNELCRKVFNSRNE